MSTTGTVRPITPTWSMASGVCEGAACPAMLQAPDITEPAANSITLFGGGSITFFGGGEINLF